MTNHNDNGRRLLWQYAGFATQLTVSLGLCVFVGYWVDKKIAWKFPVFTWLLPLLMLLVLFIKVTRDTSRK